MLKTAIYFLFLLCTCDGRPKVQQQKPNGKLFDWIQDYSGLIENFIQMLFQIKLV